MTVVVVVSGSERLRRRDQGMKVGVEIIDKYVVGFFYTYSTTETIL